MRIIIAYRIKINTIKRSFYHWKYLTKRYSQALRDFRSEMPSFTTEPDYEFYIPDSMIETKACPVSEDTMDMLSQDYSLDLNSTTCAGMQKQDNEMSCYSSSSDSDDE